MTVPGSRQSWMARERGRLGDKGGDSWEGGRPVRLGASSPRPPAEQHSHQTLALAGTGGCTQQHPVLPGFSAGCSLPTQVLSSGRRVCVCVGVRELLRPRLTASDSGSEAPPFPALTVPADRGPDGLPASVPPWEGAVRARAPSRGSCTLSRAGCRPELWLQLLWKVGRGGSRLG